MGLPYMDPVPPLIDSRLNLTPGEAMAYMRGWEAGVEAFERKATEGWAEMEESNNNAWKYRDIWRREAADWQQKWERAILENQGGYDQWAT